MKKLLPLLLMPVLAIAAASEDNPTSTVQEFYDAYIQLISNPRNDASKKWVLKSPMLTQDFKIAYRNLMESGDSDPIICGQDFPDKGYKVQSSEITGDIGVVTMTSRDPQFQNTFPVHVIRKKGRWLINGTKDIPVR